MVWDCSDVEGYIHVVNSDSGSNCVQDLESVERLNAIIPQDKKIDRVFSYPTMSFSNFRCFGQDCGYEESAML